MGTSGIDPGSQGENKGKIGSRPLKGTKLKYMELANNLEKSVLHYIAVGRIWHAPKYSHGVWESFAH